MKEQEKPWTEQKKVQLHEEYTQLRLTKSFLEAQIITIDDRMTAIRSEMLDGHLGEPDHIPDIGKKVQEDRIDRAMDRLPH